MASLQELNARDMQRPAVLIVEDEPLLRIHAADIVEEAGFFAIEANNADEAVRILETRDDIVLLFTDVQMPGSMDGLKLARAQTRERAWLLRAVARRDQAAGRCGCGGRASSLLPAPTSTIAAA